MSDTLKRAGEKDPHIQQFEETLDLLNTNWKEIKLLQVFSLVLPLSSI